MTVRDSIPEAKALSRRRVSLAWVVPLLALPIALWLGYRAWALSGTEIEVVFERGHGLGPGDAVRYRGISIGEVRGVVLSNDQSGVVVTVGLRRDAGGFARQGSRYWIVRPQVSLSGVKGVETILGARYLGATPGDGPVRKSFVGVEEPLVVEGREAGDLEVVLESADRGNLDPGTQLTYRGVQVGTILSVGLSADARTVEARALVDRTYTPLIRERTRFFMEEGLGAEVGTSFLWMEFGGRLARILGGGTVGLAVPPEAGAPVSTGHRFQVVFSPEEEWLSWQPAIALKNAHLPEGASVPTPVRARLFWRGGLFRTLRDRIGWLLPTDRGVLGPADLLSEPEDSVEGSTVLEIGGARVDLPGVMADMGPGLALATIDGLDLSPRTTLPEPVSDPGVVDCIVFRDRPDAPLSIPAHRLSVADGYLEIDRSVSLGKEWHGAPVLERDTGELIGVLLVSDEGESQIVLIRMDTSSGE